MPPTHTEQLLEPATDALATARDVVALAMVAALLVIGGAKLERLLLKRRLQVLDGEGDEVADGDST